MTTVTNVDRLLTWIYATNVSANVLPVEFMTISGARDHELEQLGWSKSELDGALARIGETLRQIYERADVRGMSTAAAADVLAEEQLKVG